MARTQSRKIPNGSTRYFYGHMQRVGRKLLFTGDNGSLTVGPWYVLWCGDEVVLEIEMITEPMTLNAEGVRHLIKMLRKRLDERPRSTRRR